MRSKWVQMRSRSGLPLRAGVVAATLLTMALPGRVAGQDGEAIFQSTCKACHTIGGGRLVGPDLAGINARQTEAWLIAFVQHSQAVIESGDPDAVALAAQYPGLVMPDWPLSDDEVRAVLAYVQQAEAAGPAPAVAGPSVPGDADLGRRLFQGTTRFANGGPACNACHDVTHQDVIAGGILATDLTTVFTRLGGPGVRAIVGSPPFPVMQRAFLDRPLTDHEVGSLVAFLQQVDTEQALHQPLDYGLGLLAAGVLGSMALLGLYSLLWRGRRRAAVNADIYTRQVRSS